MEEFRKALGIVDAGSTAEFISHGVQIVARIVLTAEDVELLEVSSERTGLRSLFCEYSRWSPDRMSPFLRIWPKFQPQGVFSPIAL